MSILKAISPTRTKFWLTETLEFRISDLQKPPVPSATSEGYSATPQMDFLRSRHAFVLAKTTNDKSIENLFDVQIVSSRRLKSEEGFGNMTNADMQEAKILKQIKMIAVLAMSVFLLTGCLYSRVTTPLDTDLNQTVLGHKVGKSSLYCVLWLFAWGDMSVAAAARQGSISTLNHMDMETHMILFGLYTRQSIIVYGD